MKRMNKHSLVKSRLGMGTVEVISEYLYVDIVKAHRDRCFSAYSVFTYHM